ncbi:MAG: electron transfer flavoprotein beta subunit [Alphaproteobacteria bacterium]|jgi:electron transfer flavoprotein beta subunit
MKVLVPIKHVVDAYVRIRVKSDETGVDVANLKHSMNPFCEIAVEEAVRLKETGVVSEIITVTIGADNAGESLRKSLAMGADRSIHIKTAKLIEPLTVAKLLKEVVVKEKPECVMLGKQSIDGDNNQTAQMLAALMEWPQATFASKITVEGGQLIVEREVDAGEETLSVKLPAVVSVDLRLNEPRNVTLPNLMKAKQKTIDVIEVNILDVDITPRIEILKVTEPAKRKAGVIVASVQELVDKLKNEARVIS